MPFRFICIYLIRFSKQSMFIVNVHLRIFPTCSKILSGYRLLNVELKINVADTSCLQHRGRWGRDSVQQ
jgi:hypothetical protein